MLDITVIIPFKDHSAMTLKCLESLFRYGPPVKEILLVDNNSSPAESEIIKAATRQNANVNLLTYGHPFNYQKINNLAASQATGSVLFLLNNDIELTENTLGLMQAMFNKAMEEKTGAVGCVLLYGDNRTIQHAGVYLVPGGTADHLYAHQKFSKIKKRINSGAASYDITKDLRVTAVTAAALMVERSKFEQIHGMNENFIIGGGDVDLCLRLKEIGYTNWLLGSSKGIMVHKESISRSNLGIPYSDFCESYKSYIKHFDMKNGDPYLHWQEVKKL